jgi:hypothetical protein
MQLINPRPDQASEDFFGGCTGALTDTLLTHALSL